MAKPVEVFHLLAGEPGAVWLDGGDSDSGWSILSFDPIESVRSPQDWRDAGRAFSAPYQADDLPFTGGCIGYVGYGSGHDVAPVPRQAPTWEPEVYLGHYDGALCFHHKSQKWHCSGPLNFRNRAEKLLSNATPMAPPEAAIPSPHQRTLPKHTFMAHVHRIHEWLRAGDCYQINLTRPIWLKDVGLSWPAYRRLRQQSAPKFGAYIQLETDLAVLCNSPELLLDLKGFKAASEPIKGTRPRGENTLEDERLMQALFDSPKDRAELTMIVDLVRNDLGRIAQLGTVSTGPRTIRTHANVHHASQYVSAELVPSADPWSTLGVLFPPGSVTGTPKIRACERIAELEEEPRGVYCGAIGYASGDRAVFNVAIRTAVWKGTECRFHVGGGIVMDSDAQDEWWETVHKASVMASSFGAFRP